MPGKILIIDDEEDMRFFLQTLFRKAGYETEVAVNGDEALGILEEFKPDMVTLDILMPKKSGLNFFQTIREQLGNKELPILVLSGISGHKEFFDNEALSGPTIFVEKPIDAEPLLSKVKELLGD